MLKFYFRWRYERAQRAAALRLPSERGAEGQFHGNFGSYLSQHSVRGRAQPRRRRLREYAIYFKWALALAIFLVIAWMVSESLIAIGTLNN